MLKNKKKVTKTTPWTPTPWEPNGIYCGSNRLLENLIIHSRNENSIILGKFGAGKAFRV